MKKLDLFKNAMKAEEFKRTAWVVSAFALIREDQDAWRKNPFPWRIVQTPAGYFYVDPDKSNELSPIDDAKVGEPLFTMKTRITLHPGDLVNVSKEIETNVGNCIVNWLCLCWPFGAKVPFVTGRIKPRQLEGLIIDRLRDTPVEDRDNGSMQGGPPRDPKFIYVDEYLNFCNAAFFLAGFSQLCVPSATPKTMTASPEIPKIKERLLKENAGRLHDPTVVAKMMAELVAHDRDVWLKDDPGADFYMGSNKSYNVVRAKAFLMHGAEVGLEEKVDVTLIENSLNQGWDIAKFPEMNDSLRAGSFNRGAQTAIGGESVKWLLRASVNMSVTEPDCGSQLGIRVEVDGASWNKLIGYYVVQGKGSVHVTEDNAPTFANKTVMVRSPMYCRLSKTDYCEHCVGDLLAQNPNGLSVAIANYGSEFLEMFMSAAHGKALLLAKMDYRKSIT